MKIAIVCTIKNEADLIDDFLAHHLAISDCLYVTDHLSDDGTYEIVRSRARSNPRLRVFEYNYRQFFQSAVMTAMTRRAARDGADWIIPLDADEFLPYSDKNELLEILLAPEWPLVQFFWQNLVPQQLLETADRHDWSKPFLTLGRQQEDCKVAIARGLALRRNFTIDQGSHGISLGRKSSPLPKGLGTLLHIPIRSRHQALKKYRKSQEGYLAIQGFNKLNKLQFVFGDAIRDGLSFVDIQSFALRYPAREIMDVVARAIPYSFKPNKYFVLQEEVPAADAREIKACGLTQHEARAVIVDQFVIVRPRRHWRARRAVAFAMVQVRLLRRRLRSRVVGTQL